MATSFRDLVGGASTTIVMAEDLTLEKRLAQLEERLAACDLAAGAGMRAHPVGDAGGDPAGAAEAGAAARVLIDRRCGVLGDGADPHPVHAGI